MNGKKILTPMRVLALSFAALIAVVLLHNPKRPAMPEATKPAGPAEEAQATELAAITGPKVAYVVPEGTRRITARIMTPGGDLVREFVITNWITIKPGQRLELSAE